MCFCQKCLNCITPSPRALSKEGGRGIEISRFWKMEGSDFPHKNGMVGKIGKVI